MKAVVYRVRSVLRRRLAATLGVTLIVTVVCGVVIAFAAGAKRTSTAPDRYTSAFGGVADARIIQDEVKQPLGEELLFGALEKGGKVVVATQDSEIEDERTGEKRQGKKLLFQCTAAPPPPAKEPAKEEKPAT